MKVKTISLVLCVATFVTYVQVQAAQISEADLLGLSKQEIDDDSERLFEYVKTTSEGIRLGCKGKVRKGDTGKVQALFIEDQSGRREFRKLGPVKARVRSEGLEDEVERYVPLRDFPMYCLERVFTSSTCPPGPAGRQGRDGRNGTIGLPGGPGLPGKNGIPGRDGNPGVKGWSGPQGAQGPRGDTGDTGPAGLPGAQGPEGPRGTDGIDGLPGVPGLVGEPGLSGTPGTPGTPGTDGIDGPPGLPGPDGLPGLAGPDGLPGIPGKAGNNGFSGVTGLDGQNGLPGQEGVPGKCCSGNGGWGGWSPDGDADGCPADLGLSSDDEDAEDNHLAEDEGLKNEPKPPMSVLSVPKPSSFWGNDMFASMNPNSFMDLKNSQKNKHKKGQNVDDEEQVEIQKVVASKASEQLEKA